IFLYLVYCTMTWHPNVTVPMMLDFGGVTDWYQEPRVTRPQTHIPLRAILGVLQIDTIMSDSEDSTVKYTTVSSPYVVRSGDVSPGEDGPPVMPEDPYAYVVAAFQALPEPDYMPIPEEPEQAPTSPIYIPYVPKPEYPEYIPVEDEDNDDEDPEEDPADYPTDHDDDDEEEEHSASADSIPPPLALRVTARISFRPQPLTLSFTKEEAKRFLAMPIPPSSPLTPLSSPLP
nr:hypothetical protein [Tanacetum cinerariifolium]